MAWLIRTAKELARQLLHSAGRKRPLAHLEGARAERFERIYDTGVWKCGDDNAPASGLGSSSEVTEPLQRALPQLVEELDVGTLLDIGCGDFTWMQKVELGCRYIGVDIVESVVEANRANHAAPNREFIMVDAVEGLPGIRADLVLCREVIFHLSFAEGRQLLHNALATGCKYLLTTSDRSTLYNADIESGDFRVVNLERRPFGLPPPMRIIDDARLVEGRIMGLWGADAVRAALQTRA